MKAGICGMQADQYQIIHNLGRDRKTGPDLPGRAAGQNAFDSADAGRMNRDGVFNGTGLRCQAAV